MNNADSRAANADLRRAVVGDWLVDEIMDRESASALRISAPTPSSDDGKGSRRRTRVKK
jgi:hypothetical protein